MDYSSLIFKVNKKNYLRQFGRVVKASDSKSDGATRTSSNPVAVDLFIL